MSIVSLILLLVVVGFCAYVLLTYVPMPGPIRQLVIALMAIAVVLWVLNASGIYRTTWLRW